MGTRDPRVDAYIAKSADFAKPILTHIREVIHEECPDVEETLKWNAPHFMYHGMLGGFASFKEHCAFGFWKGKLIVDDDDTRARAAMGQFGMLKTLKDLPPDRKLRSYVKKAMALNESGTKAPRPLKHPRKRIPDKPPTDLAAALKRSAKARKTFESFTPSARREYVEWITDAKRAETRAKRLATTLEWLAQGKKLHWKYE